MKAKEWLKEKGIHPTEPIYWDTGEKNIYLDELMDEFISSQLEPLSYVDAGGFTDKQKTIISKAVLKYLKESTRIIDKDGKEYPDFIIDKVYDSLGLDYYLENESQHST